MSEEKQEGPSLSEEDIKALKALLKKENEKSSLGKKEEEKKVHPVTREEIARANKRLKLGLDLSESDLSSLIFTALTAMEEIYGVRVGEGLSLDEQFREAVDTVGVQLLEKNKERAGEERKINNPIILQALDQIN